MANEKRGTFVACHKCGCMGGKITNPVVVKEVQEDGSEKEVKKFKVECCTLRKDGDGYCCHPQC